MDKKINLTIDGIKVEAEPGMTVLQAARANGIEIPTFCYIETMKPFASCFMCVVRIKGGRDNLVPSCATPVAEGMEIETQTEEIQEARKTALELMFSDHVGDCFAPCYNNCPTGIDIPGFISALRQKNPEKSIEIIKDSLPIPASLGRVCPAPCEKECRRSLVDEPLSIMTLKRYAADVDMEKPEPYVPRKKRKPTGKKIAVVGAGPAGLSVAYFSQILGHQAEVFEAHPKPGGMLRYGIPAYRLPREVIDHEVSIIEKLGAKFHYNKVMGKDFTLEDLRKNYDAVFLGVGAQDSGKMRVEGEDSEVVMSAIEFLAKTSSGELTSIGDKVMIVGGGNSAIDAARSAIRLGCKESVIYYRRTRKEMPAFDFEIEEALKDGVKIEFLSAPIKIENKDGKAHVTCVNMELGEPDSSGRRRPVPVSGSEHVVIVDTVIAAIGQKVSKLGLENTELKLTRWGTLVVEDNTMRTNLPDVFSGGDSVLGPDIAVRASGMGRLAAISIDQYVTGREVTGSHELFQVTMGNLESIPKTVYAKYNEMERVVMPHITPSEATNSFREVATGLSAEQVEHETSRCLECGCREADACKLRIYAENYKPDPLKFKFGDIREIYIDDSHPDIIFESNKCITCGNCVRICEEDKKCYALAFEKRGFKTRIRPPMQKLLVETSCDGCGKCVEACPTGALTYKNQPVWTEVIRRLD